MDALLQSRRVVPISEFLPANHRPCAVAYSDDVYNAIRAAEKKAVRVDQLLLSRVPCETLEPESWIQKTTLYLDDAIRNHSDTEARRELVRLFSSLDVNVLDQIRVLGEGSKGSACETCILGESEAPIVLKTFTKSHIKPDEGLTREHLSSNLAHEAVAGLYLTNPLRNIIPNFAYIFGGDSERVIYEAITGACDIDAVWTGDRAVGLDTALMTLVQVSMALHVAGERCDYGHNDLHPGNVLYKETPATTIAYPCLDGTTVHLVGATHLAIIIDFGSSVGRLWLNGQWTRVAPPGLPTRYGITPFRSQRGYDIFRFFMTMMYIIEGPTRQALLPLARIFGSGETMKRQYSDDAMDNISMVPIDRDFSPLEFVREIQCIYNPRWLKINAPRVLTRRRAPLWQTSVKRRKGRELTGPQAAWAVTMSNTASRRCVEIAREYAVGHTPTRLREACRVQRAFKSLHESYGLYSLRRPRIAHRVKTEQLKARINVS